MKFRLIWSALVISIAAFGQQPPLNSPLLDHLAGKWVLEGTMARQHVVDDVEAEWVLNHHYLRLHELSRAKRSNGLLYEAFVFIAWNEAKGPDFPQHYSCAWMDIWGGFARESIGEAAVKENELPFIFKDEKGEPSFSNVFRYDPTSDTWTWSLDNIDKGERKPFARVTLTRKK